MRNIIVHRPRGRHGLVLLSGLEWFLEKFVTITGMICAPDPSNISLPMHRALETGDCAAPFPSVMKHPPAKPASSQQVFLKKRVQRFGHLLASSRIERKHHRVRFPFSSPYGPTGSLPPTIAAPASMVVSFSRNTHRRAASPAFHGECDQGTPPGSSTVRTRLQ